MTKRRKIGAKDKMKILRKHLQKKEPMSEICKTHEMTPASIYQWQEILFSRGHEVFENKVGRPKDEKLVEKKVCDLEAKLAAKNTVISELMEELLLEKKLGGAISKVAGSLRN